MTISDTQLSNLYNRLSASEKSGDYNARNFVDVPRQDLQALLNDYARIKSELQQRRTEIATLRETIDTREDIQRERGERE